MTLAKAARAARIPLREAQLYLEKGLLRPPRRRCGRSADDAFHNEHVRRLCFIKKARGYGFTLEDIAQLVEPDCVATCADVYRLTLRRLEEVARSDALDTSKVVALDTLLTSCGLMGSRQDCQILATLGVEPARARPG